MAMNLQKVVQDLHGASEQTKVVALTPLLKLPDTQLLADQEIFRQLHRLSQEGAQRAQGDLGTLFVQLWERLERIRASHQAALTGASAGIDLAALGRGTPRVQVETLRKIREARYEAALGEVRALLEVGAVDRVLVEILKTLGDLGSRDQDLVRFRRFLGHPAGAVRAAAVRSFSRFAEPKEAIHILGPALGDRHPLARMCAIRGLAGAGKDGILGELERLIGSESAEERARSLSLLRYLRGDEVLELVRRLAADPSDSIRLDVVHILRSHGGTHVYNTLEWLAQDQNPRVRTFAARSLMLLKRGRGICPGLDISQLATVPGELDAPPMPELTGLEPRELVQALMRIKRHGTPEAYDALATLLEDEDQKPEVLASLLSALSVIGGREDIPRVRPYLAHMDGRVRANAVEAVDVMGGRKEILTWLTPLLADSVPRVRRNVLVALGRFGEGVFLNHLQRMIHSSHVPVRISGAYALAHYPGAAAFELGKQVLQDKEAEVRLNFAEALAGKSEPWTKQILETILKSDLDHRVRAAAQISLEAPSGAQVGPEARVTSASAVGAGLTPGAPPAGLPPLGDGGGANFSQPPPVLVPTTPGVPNPPPGAPTPAPGAQAGAAPPPAAAAPAYTMVDGLPMCPLPDAPNPNLKVGRGIQREDGFEIPAGPGGPPAAFTPSVDIPADLVLGAASMASGQAAPAAPGLDLAAAAPPTEASGGGGGGSEETAGEVLVLESMKADAQDGKEGAESSTDLLGQTFMNFAAFISPGKMAGMKQIQALEKERNQVLEKMGRILYKRIDAGTLSHAVFERTLFVLKKYLHNKKQMSGKDPAASASSSGWFGGLFGGGAPDDGANDMPQLRAQYRNLAKDALKVREGGEIDLSDCAAQLKEIDGLDEKIQALRDQKE